jgi:hypothetical protein
MELAIPLLALGGMYVISNKKSSDEKPEKITQENFNNMGRKPNYLPNTKIPPENYPVLNTKQLVETVQEYPNPNVATDKYFNQTMKSVGGQQIASLTGNYLDNDQFKHSNMVPFNGGKVKGNMYNANISESVLDNMNGSGSQLFRKVEQGPLFKPEENMQWAYGAPNQSDFFQSRVNPGMRNNNVKPFESENVGPGLNQGYGTSGSGGYNSGMEARDKWREKTVDELRVATNPKMEYNLVNHEGPAGSVVKNVGLIGRVEKQGPDRFYMNTQDRWFTTTGAEKGETLRPIQEMGILRRNDVEIDYAGPAGPSDRKAAYAPENFEPSKRNEVMGGCVNHSTAVGKGPSTDGETFIRSHTNFSTHRSSVLQPDTMRSGFGGAIGAVIAPFMDILRPSRKEECAHSVRVYGEAGTRVPHSYVINQNDTTQTTIKETTLYAPSFNIDGQKEGVYVNNQSQFNDTQRDTTSCSYIGSSGGHGSQYGSMVYESAYNQRNNEVKPLTINNRPNQGGTSMFNNQMNVNIGRQDCDRFNYRVNAPSSVVQLPPSKEVYGRTVNKQVYSNEINNSRLDGNLLQAFRDNPYTHSLTTSV